MSKYQIKKFADEIKNTVCRWIGCIRERLEDRDFKEKELGPEWWYYNTPTGLVNYADYEAMRPLVEFEHNVELIKLTPRKLMQLLGTEAGREIIHPNIWVNALFADYSSSFVPCEQWKENRESIVKGSEKMYMGLSK